MWGTEKAKKSKADHQRMVVIASMSQTQEPMCNRKGKKERRTQTIPKRQEFNTILRVQIDKNRTKSPGVKTN